MGASGVINVLTCFVTLVGSAVYRPPLLWVCRWNPRKSMIRDSAQIFLHMCEVFVDIDCQGAFSTTRYMFGMPVAPNSHNCKNWSAFSLFWRCGSSLEWFMMNLWTMQVQKWHIVIIFSVSDQIFSPTKGYVPVLCDWFEMNFSTTRTNIPPTE